MIPGILILSAAVILTLASRAKRRSGSRGGGPRRSYAVLMMVVLPVLWLAGALAYADTATKATSFCLMCHEMEPYGESVAADNASVSAAHFRNGWTEQGTACYVCHTSPGLSGAVEAKMKGLRNVFVHYLGDVPDEIHLDAPYDAAICLICHRQDEAFLELGMHRNLVEESPDGEVTCAGCHAVAHVLGD